jgi:vitamin B12 transporter
MFLSKKSSILAALCLLALSTKGQNSLAEITVTTTKLPQKESQLAKSAIILNDSILNAHAGWSVSDLLQKQVGISIVGASQPLGSIQSVFMRGGNSGHTLLLLDFMTPLLQKVILMLIL